MQGLYKQVKNQYIRLAYKLEIGSETITSHLSYSHASFGSLEIHLSATSDHKSQGKRPG